MPTAGANPRKTVGAPQNSRPGTTCEILSSGAVLSPVFTMTNSEFVEQLSFRGQSDADQQIKTAKALTNTFVRSSKEVDW